MRLPAVLLHAFLLSGCWFGDRFYAGERPSAAVAPGHYVVIMPGRTERERMRVSLRRDGMTLVSSPGEMHAPAVFGFAPLPGHRDVFVAWQEEERTGVRGDKVLYGIVAARRGGEYRVLTLFCGQYPAVAASAGAEINGDVCTFTSRAGLERALGAVASHLDSGLRMVPAGRVAR